MFLVQIRIILSTALVLLKLACAEDEDEPIRFDFVSFGDGAYMGLEFALVIPLEGSFQDASLSLCFEANYFLPEENGVIGPPTIEGRSKQGENRLNFINRTSVYQLIENKLETYNYPGRFCLLRTICEINESNLENNGVLGDILRLLFTPSSSMNESLPEDFRKAEENGKKQQCNLYYTKCDISLLDFVSLLSFL